MDEHFARLWQTTGRTWAARDWHRRRGGATFRLIRYADDLVVMINASRHHAEELKSEVATVLEAVGLRLSQAKTTIAHIDEGLDFLSFRIQRHRKPSMQAVLRKVKAISRQNIGHSLDELLIQLNWLTKGWANYFRPLGGEGEPELPGLLHVAPGLAMDPPQAPPGSLEAAQTPTPRPSGRLDLVA
ncbi:reverse transcriptase domain-containing protein [Streptomyces netropsis]|uniref:reverse transcriptase domain-containing protein n=1 Tax=Streptomyces netropsis TaxID=55404 RepID=UPI0037BACB99